EHRRSGARGSVVHHDGDVAGTGRLEARGDARGAEAERRGDAHAVLPLRLRGALRRLLPSSLVPRSSVQAAPRPFGALTGRAPAAGADGDVRRMVVGSGSKAGVMVRLHGRSGQVFLAGLASGWRSGRPARPP